MRFRDPVCGMEIRWEEAVDYQVLGPVVVYFCCPGCAARFREDPDRHVDVRAWMTGEPRGGPTDCSGAPLHLQPEEATVRKSSTLAASPRIGGLTLDEIETLLARRWRSLLGDDQGRLRARTLERALLTYALVNDPDRRRDIDRLLAAEVARLRARDVDSDRIESELAVLPRAFADVLLGVSAGPLETAEVYETIESKFAEIRPWISSDHTAPSASATHAGRARAS